MIDVQFLLRATPGVGQAGLETVARRWLASSGTAPIQAAVKMPDDALPALAHAATPDPTLPDIILSIVAETASGAEERIGGLAAALDDTLLPDESSLLATQRHAILQGRDHIRLFFGLRRLSRLSPAAFHDYWLNHHADFGRRLIPPYSYHQLHADRMMTKRLATATSLAPSDLDGIVEVDFPDIDAFVDQLSRPDVAEEALADERKFIDHSRSMMWAYRTI